MNRISTEEVKKLMAKMKKGRDIGADDIPVEEERCKNISVVDLRTELFRDLQGWRILQEGDAALRHIYTIIRHKSVDVRKRQVAILARSPREMSQTDRILPGYILSRVCVSVRPIIFFIREKTANHSRFAAAKQLHWNGHNRFSWVAQRQELIAKTFLRSAAIRVQTPCTEQYLFHFYCLRLTRLTFNKS